MSVFTGVTIQCDYSLCRKVFRSRKSITGARRDSKQEGWDKRGIWDLCPEHRDVKHIVASAEVSR